jgi:hypothetical protein
MKNFKILSFLVLVVVVVIFACSKSVSNPVLNTNGSTANQLFPIKQGNSWVYQDSVFDATQTMINVYVDSMYLKTNTTSYSGVVFTALNDSLGWFGSKGFIANSADLYNVYALDSANSAPYLFFASSGADNSLIASNQDYSNPACFTLDQLYGFITTYTINGNVCYKNISLVKDCNGNVTNTNVVYVSPGIGLVRLENYIQVPGSTSHTLYRNFSQTLTKAILK